MKRTIWIPILVIGALAMAALLGLAIYHSAKAATPAATGSAENIFARASFGRGFGGGYTKQDLADALGISVDELTTAIQKAKEAALTQAVEKGLITQAQADTIKSRGFAFPLDGRWAGWLSQNGIDFDALLADALGITVEKLQAAYAQAYNARIDQAVANGRITQEQADLLKGRYALFNNEKFQSAMQSAFEEAVRQAVADGVITQAQADAILENAAGMGFRGFKGFGGFGDFGRGWGGGFGRHKGWGAPDNSIPPKAPSATPSNDT